MYKFLSRLVALVFILVSLPMVSAQAAVYNMANYLPLVSGAATGERVYMFNDPYGYPSVTVEFERSAGLIPARLTPTDTSAATVPAQLIQASGGVDYMWTVDVTGVTRHGVKGVDSQTSSAFTYYVYDFIAPPVSAATVTFSDFDVANLTKPSAIFPVQVDTAIQNVFTHAYGGIYEDQNSQDLEYIVETITIDDNAGLLHDLTNPAHPDYNPDLVAMWDVANGGSGVALLQNLLKITRHSEYTGVTYGGAGAQDQVQYLAVGVGVVYQLDVGSSSSMLAGYTLGAVSGSIGGLSQAIVQVQDVYGAAVSGGGVKADAYIIDPYTGTSFLDYTSSSNLEETPGSGQYKLYFGTGDVLDVSVTGAGYSPELYPSQDLYTLAAASAPAPVAYAVITPLSVLTGTVLDPLGLPVQGAHVAVQAPELGIPPGVYIPVNTVGTASTDVYGFYSVEVPSGQYLINVDGGWDNFTGQPLALPNNGVAGYIDPYAATTPNQTDAQFFDVPAASQVVANVTLTQGAAISGTILDPLGLPVSNTWVSFEGLSVGYWGYGASTDSYGFYSATVTPGQYYVRVNSAWDNITGQSLPLPNNGVAGYIDPYGNTTANQLNGQVFNLFAGTPTIANATLSEGALISGTILDSQLLPLVNAQISLQGEAGGYFNASTDAYGFYSAVVASDAYRIYINAGYDPITYQPTPVVGVLGYIDPYGSTVGDYWSANLFIASVGAPVIADATLATPSVISGTILDPLGLPVANANVSLQGETGGYGNATTDVYGFYSAQVTADLYRINITGAYDPYTGQPLPLPNIGVSGYIDPYGATTSDYWGANLFTVVAGGTTVADAQLTAGAVIQGTVLDPLGFPVVNANVSLQGQAGSYSYVTTDNYGFYSTVVSADSYRIDINSGSYDPYTGQALPLPNVGLAGYIDPYGNTTSNYSAANIFVAAAGTTTVADAQLTAGAIIQGTILDPLGLPVPSANLSLQGQAGGYTNATTDIYGFYSAVVSADSYRVNIYSGSYDPYTGQTLPLPNGGITGYIDAYGNTTSNYAAANVFVAAPGATTIANSTLTQGVALDVTVLDPLGAPLANAPVTFDGLSYQSYYTNNQGVASVNVVPGLYRIGVDTGGWSTPYIGGYLTASGWLTADYLYASQFDISSATSFTVQMFNFVGDRDGDGVLDYLDSFPDDAMYNADTDLDHLADAWEIQFFGNLTTANQFTDGNGNGVLDIQEFIAGTNPIVVRNLAFIADGASGPVLSVVDTYGAAVSNPVSFFNASATLLASTPIDIDGDGINEYAVVVKRADNLIMCQVRSANGVLIKAFYVANSLSTTVLNVYAAQMDMIAGEELVVGKVRSSDNQPIVAVHNPSTGAKNMETYMLNSNWTANNFFAVDADGDGVQEIALAGIKANSGAPVTLPVNRPAVQIRFADGSMYGYVFALSIQYHQVQFARIDLQGDGIDEIIALGYRNSDNARIVSVQDIATSTNLVQNRIFDTSYTVSSMMIGDVDGIAGDELVLGGTLNSNGRIVADIRNVVTNSRIKMLYMQTSSNTLNQFGLVDWDHNGTQDIMVRATNITTLIPSYLVKRSDNTVVYSGMPVGISGTGDRYTGDM